MKLFISVLVVIFLSSFLISNHKLEAEVKVKDIDNFPILDTNIAVQLGKKLFHDPVMSRDSSISCATCHQQHLAFTDGLKTSIGFRGQRVTRNSPTLVNFQEQKIFLLDGVNPSLESQVLVPIQEHKEFDFHIALIEERLKRNPEYVLLSKNAFGTEPNTIVITKSIAEFERTLISNNSAFDQYLKGEQNALSNSEKRGKDLFFEKLYCSTCHSGNNFTNYSLTNNGLYEIYADTGRKRLTDLEEDLAVFKVPTLRNIELTAPYMHDGSISTLQEVIEHYSSGGAEHKNKSQVIKPFKLTSAEKIDLINFLKSLTDHDFITNPEFGL